MKIKDKLNKEETISNKGRYENKLRRLRHSDPINELENHIMKASNKTQNQITYQKSQIEQSRNSNSQRTELNKPISERRQEANK